MDAELLPRCAVVDCGTNTFTLHIAEMEGGNWNSVFRQRRFVRLGRDSFRSGRLSPQRMLRGVDVLRSFHETACNHGVGWTRAFGCSAVRDAANGDAFVRAAMETGWHVEVLDGEMEASLIHTGVADTLSHEPALPEALLTVDIGGGSVEMVHWSASGVIGSWSLDLGVARLTDWIKPSDPLKQQDIASICRIADAAWAPVLEAVASRPPAWLIGTSGAFDALLAMENPASKWSDRRMAQAFDLPALKARCGALGAKTMEELHAIPGLHPDRIPYLSVASILIGHMLERFGSVQRVLRSRHTLAEGALVEAARGWRADGQAPRGWTPLGSAVR